ncbi:MAG: glutathione S-transferase N-terminal domain-containing protein [Saccharospirillaceae bacterium]|nr:glutathione S-transferase N-terminal domain-containing protein [Pseudomonadales bacterium]NRB77491.1 glutathione S-transferase N-terminal domain-containing protein [Saccharospirillaceae bacterium]
MTNQNQLFLYSFRRCPYAMRARMALKISGLKIELREILLKDKPSCMLEFSNKATVPVLVIDNKTVIDESYDIMLWALKQHDPDNWLVMFDKSETLIKQCDFEFKPILDSYKYNDQNKELQLKSREDSCIFLNKIEHRLLKTNYLFSNEITLADIAIFPFIRQYAYVDIKWFEKSEFKAINLWLKKLINSELFETIMQKYPLFKQSNKTVFLG